MDGGLYNFESFDRLIRRIASSGYEFTRFDGALEIRREKIIYLRHDVDISPAAALKVGRMEASAGLRASFFFQIGAETYNIFSPPTLSIIGDLRDLGHGVGLHIDETLLGCEPARVRQTVSWFRESVAPIDPVISFHRPTSVVFGKTYDGLVNAYEDRFFSAESYLSDSRRNEEFYPKLVHWVGEGRSPIQLLLHPEWWYPEPDIARFKDLLVRRRVSELEAYLKRCFNRVFGDLIKDEDGNSGL